ncbi:MAG: hypothetical protein K2Q09_06130 [Phycisphaerales bacterium]|nr:hypothetical protein [Phycisphaerales bacterium]
MARHAASVISVLSLSTLTAASALAQLGGTCQTAPQIGAGTFAFNLLNEPSETGPFTSCLFPAPAHDQWAAFFVPQDGFLSISITDATEPVGLAIYDTCGAEAFSVACTQTGDCPDGVALKRSVTAGSTLYIRVTGIDNGRPSGNLVVQNLAPAPGASCDNPATAVLGLNAYNTALSPANEAWFVYTPAVTGGLSVRLCGLSGQGDSLALWSGCTPEAILDRGNYYDDDFAFPPCRAATHAAAGVPVYIAFYQTCPRPAQFELFIDPALVPANDTCDAAATAVEGSNPFDNTYAATDEFEPCFGDGLFTGGKDVFFAFTPTATAEYDISTVAAETVQLNGTTLSISSACGAPPIACSNSGFSAYFRTSLTAGQRYVIRAAGVGRLSDGTPFERGTATLNIRRLIPPANDLCANATPIGQGETAFDLRDAGADGPALCSGQTPDSDVWFLYTPAFSGPAELGLLQDQTVTSADVSIVNACGGTTTRVSGAAIDPQTGAQYSRLTFNAQTGVPVLVRVSGTIPYPLTGEGLLYAGPVRNPVPPANDRCEDARALQAGVPTPFSVVNATRTVLPCYPDVNCTTDACTTAITNDIYFTFTATESGPASLNVDDGEPYFQDGAYRAGAVTAVLPGCGERPIACGLECGDFPGDSLDFEVRAGATYFVRIGAYAGAPWDALGGVVTLTLPGCPADIGRAGGLPGSDGALDNNDFIAFIGAFFAGEPLADRGSAGGLPGSDGAFDNNDFIVFINQFFGGC